MPTHSLANTNLAKGDKVKITLPNSRKPIHGTVKEILSVNGADEVWIDTPRGVISMRVITTPRRIEHEQA